MRAWRHGLLAAVVFIQGARLFSQTPQSPPPAQTSTASVEGRVVAADTGAPIAGATVSALVAVAVPAGTTPPPAVRVVTDSDGRFHIEGLAAGRVQLSASAPGYVTSAYRPTSPSLPPVLTAGRALAGVTIRLSHGCSIAGTVRDELGAPMTNVPVEVFQRIILTTRRAWSRVRTSFITDAQGVYHNDSMPPGEYIVAVPVLATTIPTALVDAIRHPAAGDPSLASLVDSVQNSRGPFPIAGFVPTGAQSAMLTGRYMALPLPSAAPGKDGEPRTYRTTYYPAATTMNDAGIVELRSGEARSDVNIQLLSTPSRRVTGTILSGPVTSSFVGVHLIAAQSDEANVDYDVEAALGATDRAGAYTFLNVPDGDYALKVVSMSRLPTQGNPVLPPAVRLIAWAEEALHVGTADVTRAPIAMRPPLTISGRAIFGGAGAQPPAGEATMRVWTAAIDGGMLAPPAAVTLDGDGRFTLQGAMAGRYQLLGGGTGDWMVESVKSEDHDVTSAPLRLTDHDVTDVALTLTSRITRVVGYARDATGAPVPNAHVVIFPADAARWIADGMSIRVMRSLRTTPGGTFDIGSLPPGDYLMAAFPDGDIARWPDRRVAEAVAKVATKVTVAHGAPIPVTLLIVRSP